MESPKISYPTQHNNELWVINNPITLGSPEYHIQQKKIMGYQQPWGYQQSHGLKTVSELSSNQQTYNNNQQISPSWLAYIHYHTSMYSENMTS